VCQELEQRRLLDEEELRDLVRQLAVAPRHLVLQQHQCCPEQNPHGTNAVADRRREGSGIATMEPVAHPESEQLATEFRLQRATQLLAPHALSGERIRAADDAIRGADVRDLDGKDVRGTDPLGARDEQRWAQTFRGKSREFGAQPLELGRTESLGHDQEVVVRLAGEVIAADDGAGDHGGIPGAKHLVREGQERFDHVRSLLRRRRR
jgi:hypothetical protein